MAKGLVYACALTLIVALYDASENFVRTLRDLNSPASIVVVA